MLLQPREIRSFAAALACALLAAAPVCAQEPPVAASDAPAEDAEAPLDEYRVELIVFEYDDSLAGTTEDWPTPAGDEELAGQEPPEEDIAQAMPSPAAEEADDEAAELVFRFRPVPEREYGLTGLADRLRRNGGYRPLLHVAWEQPGYDPATAQSLDLGRLAELPERLRGEAKLYRSRFLHLLMDLELLSSRAPRTLPPGTDAIAALQPDIFRLRESRKMKSGELHYFDHPRYGVVARVTPIERPEPETLSRTRP